jgi:4a-hydroxytetrahydrobiopterin dehydratase
MNYVEENNKLVIRLKPLNYMQGLEWVNKTAQLAEEMNHHPDILFTYSQVEICICTHDKGNVVTEKDHEFMNRLKVVL